MRLAEFKTTDGRVVWVNPEQVVYVEPDLTKHEAKLSLLNGVEITVLEIAARVQDKLEATSRRDL